MRRRGWAAFALALAAVLAAVGCGGGGDSDSESRAAPEPGAAVTEPSPRETTEPPLSAPPTTDRTEPDVPSGCAADPPPGTTTEEVMVAGEVRTYVRHVPAGRAGEPLPLVMTLHGLGATGAEQMADTGWADLADREGAVVVAPDARGLLRGWDVTSGVDQPDSDLAFLVAVLDDVAAAVCVDPEARLLNGISNGAALTFAAVCAGGVGFASFGGVAGAIGPEGCPDAPSAPITYFHGDADPVVPLDRPEGLQILPPARPAIEAWVAHGRCAASPVTDQLSPSVTRSTWGGCAGGDSVTLHVVAGGGHTWPGGRQAPDAAAGPTTTEIDATQIMWDAFVG